MDNSGRQGRQPGNPQDRAEANSMQEISKAEAAGQEAAPADRAQEVNYCAVVEKMCEEDLSSLFHKAEQADLYLDMLQRTRADYENYQKRKEQEQSNIYKYANQALLQKVVGVLEFLDRAITSAPGKPLDQNFLDGICLVQKEFHKLLGEFAVTPIEAVGKRYDPLYHEAVIMKSAEGQADMTILEELEKGFMFHDRTLRATKVVVNRVSAPVAPEIKKEEEAPKKA